MSKEEHCKTTRVYCNGEAAIVAMPETLLEHGGLDLIFKDVRANGPDEFDRCMVYALLVQWAMLMTGDRRISTTLSPGEFGYNCCLRVERRYRETGKGGDLDIANEILAISSESLGARGWHCPSLRCETLHDMPARHMKMIEVVKGIACRSTRALAGTHLLLCEDDCHTLANRQVVREYNLLMMEAIRCPQK